MSSSVDDIGARAQNTESVGESLRDVQLVLRGGVENDADPAAEAVGPAAYVDRHIEDPSRENRDELRLRVLDLIVQAAQDGARRPRMVVLHEPCVDTRRPVALFAVRFQEETAVVGEDAGLDDPDLRKLGGNDLHAYRLADVVHFDARVKRSGGMRPRFDLGTSLAPLRVEDPG